MLRYAWKFGKAFYQQTVRFEENWPPSSVHPMPLYMCTNTASLQTEPLALVNSVQYRAASKHERAVFSYRFESGSELIGSMRLKLWVSTSDGDDLDLFIVLRKLDVDGREVFFSGFNGYERDAVAKGWLRVSLRELDESRCTALRPWHTYDRIQKVRPGEIVPAEIEIWPSATLFEIGTTLQLTIQGHDAAKYPMLGHRKLLNRGRHTILTGGPYDSCLTIPLNQLKL